MLSFFFYVIIYCWSYLFTFIFHAESVGVYVHFDFLCWYLAFFDQLIIIVLCSFDSKQIPRNKKKCCSQSFFFKYFYFWMLDARRCLRCRERGEGGRRRLLTQPEFLIRSPSLQWFPLIPKSGIISIQMKPGAEPAQHYHLPIDDYANSYTVHRCNERERGKKKKRDWRWKRLLEGSGVVTTAERNGVGFSLESEPFVRAHTAKWDSPQPYGRVMSYSMAAAPAFPARFYTVHISCKWAFTELVINLQ